MMRHWLFVLVCVAVGMVCCACGGDGNAADDDGNAAGDDDGVSSETWVDPHSDLTWQVTPSAETLSRTAAKIYCDELTLDGGGWHLPTISELRTLIRGCPATMTDGSCSVTDSCLDIETCQDPTCDDCSFGDGPNHGCYGPAALPGECGWYWSSSPTADGNRRWLVDFGFEGAGAVYYDYSGYYGTNVRCVR